MKVQQKPKVKKKINHMGCPGVWGKSSACSGQIKLPEVEGLATSYKDLVSVKDDLTRDISGEACVEEQVVKTGQRLDRTPYWLYLDIDIDVDKEIKLAG